MAKRWLASWLLAMACAVPAYAQTVEYIHTDALGSPVAVTNSAGQVIERREYEPYGAQLAPTVSDGPGYTGHVQDAATGLVYMQQRYYDPGIGRFLSVDPVTANGNTGGNFNRYWYANNNPYRFTDPDGRLPECAPNCTLEQADAYTAGQAKAIVAIFGAPWAALAGSAAVLATPAEATAGLVVAWRYAKSPEGKAVACLLIGCSTHNPATPRDALGKVERKPTIKVVEQLRRKEERRAGERAERQERATRQSQEPEKPGSGDVNLSGFQGSFRVGGRIDSMRLDRELSPKK